MVVLVLVNRTGQYRDPAAPSFPPMDRYRSLTAQVRMAVVVRAAAGVALQAAPAAVTPSSAAASAVTGPRPRGIRGRNAGRRAGGGVAGFGFSVMGTFSFFVAKGCMKVTVLDAPRSGKVAHRCRDTGSGCPAGGEGRHTAATRLS
ncbi:hypothetical protein GCM10010360_17110 [Streptomyces nogalater]